MKGLSIIVSILSSLAFLETANAAVLRDAENLEARQARTTTTTRRTTTSSTRAATTLRTTARVVTTTRTTPAATSVVTTTRVSTTPAVVPSSSTTAVQSSSTTSSAAAPSNSLSSDGSPGYINPIITQHNLHRSNHSASNIVWDTALANTAQKIAAKCVYAHDTATDGGGYGQNIGAGFTPSKVPSMITNYMYNNEMANYRYYGSEPSFANFSGWGHFSQIVWKGTARLGCYTQYCEKGLANANGIPPYFTVCNYGPAGNSGNYAGNVGAPLGNPRITV